jgi:hypothetical protein
MAGFESQGNCIGSAFTSWVKSKTALVRPQSGIELNTIAPVNLQLS